MWETFALLQFFDAPLFIYKRELAWIPFFGWYLMKSNMIGVDRDGGMRSLMEMARRAGEGNPPRPAADHLSRRHPYARSVRRRTTRPASGRSTPSSGVACLPVALNSGLFWPRRTFMRYPGTLVVEFLDPLPPGLAAQGIHRAGHGRDRGSHRPAGRDRAAGAGAIVRPGAEFGEGEGVGRRRRLPFSQAIEPHRCSGVSSCSISAS